MSFMCPKCFEEEMEKSFEEDNQIYTYTCPNCSYILSDLANLEINKKEWISGYDNIGDCDNKYLVMFDLDEFSSFIDSDRRWVEINEKEKICCVSHEGVHYEPEFFGKLVKKKIKLEPIRYLETMVFYEEQFPLLRPNSNDKNEIDNNKKKNKKR